MEILDNTGFSLNIMFGTVPSMVSRSTFSSSSHRSKVLEVELKPNEWRGSPIPLLSSQKQNASKYINPKWKI
jgi:hypothetical protein